MEPEDNKMEPKVSKMEPDVRKYDQRVGQQNGPCRCIIELEDTKMNVREATWIQTD